MDQGCKRSVLLFRVMNAWKSQERSHQHDFKDWLPRLELLLHNNNWMSLVSCAWTLLKSYCVSWRRCGSNTLLDTKRDCEESFFMLSNSWDWSHEAAFGCCTCHYNLTSLHPPPLLSFLHPFLVFAILRRQEDSRKEKRTSLNFWQNCECPFLIMTLVSYDLFHPQLPPLRREDTILGCWAIYK